MKSLRLVEERAILQTRFVLLEYMSLISCCLRLSSNCRVKLAKNNYLVDGFGELPPTEYQQVRPNSGSRVPVARGRRQTHVVTLLPGHALGRPYLEILAVALHLLRLVGRSVAGEVSPSAEQNDIRTRDVESMTIAGIRRNPRDTQPGPVQLLGVKHANIVEIAGAQRRARG